MSKSDAETITQLREALQQHEELLKKLQENPHGYVVISHVQDDKVFLTSIAGGRTLTNKKAMVVDDYKVGDWFEVVGEDGALFKKLENVTIGRSAEVVKVRECSVQVKVQEHVVEVAPNPNLDLRLGDTVRVDPGMTVITALLEKAKEKAKNDLDRQVHWADVGGQVEAKIELIEAIEQPLKHPTIFAKYGKRAPKGVLMYGPPGCGKTLLGKAVATSLAGEAQGCFIYVKGPELLNPYVGVSESNVREIFARARAHRAEFNTPAVVFIDEADALLGARGKSHSTSRIEDTVVPQFLAEMDGMNETEVMVILATNRPDTLDPAVVRDGRVDRKIRVGRPNQQDSEAILKLYLGKVPCAEDLNALAASIAHDLFEVERNLYELRLDNNEMAYFGLPQLVSGALLEGLVEKATALAIRRELTKAGGPEGLTQHDLIQAVETVYRQNIDMNHHDAIEDFAVPHRVTATRKLIHAT